jgi:hypothetical protein
VSILKPKDGDYVSRGLLLLIAWVCFVAPGPFTVVGALLAGGAGAIIGLFTGVVAGVAAFGWYLNYGTKQHRARL